MNLYTYAAMIENKAEEGRILTLVMDIVETDLICEDTEKLKREHLDELRKLGEHKLADAIEKDYSGGGKR